MKMVRMVFLILLCALILLAIVARLDHNLIHWGGD